MIEGAFFVVQNDNPLQEFSHALEELSFCDPVYLSALKGDYGEGK